MTDSKPKKDIPKEIQPKKKSAFLNSIEDIQQFKKSEKKGPDKGLED